MLWIWVALAAGGAVAEAHTGALAGAAIAASAVAAGIVGVVGLPPWVQVAAFAAAAGALLGLVRPWIARQRVRYVHPPEMLVGKPGTVADPTDEQLASGRVLIEGASYVARCAPGTGRLPVGTMIRVLGADTGELVVQRL